MIMRYTNLLFTYLLSVSSQIIPRLVGRLGSEVRVSVSSQGFALRMFVSHGRHVFVVPSAVPCVGKVIFLSRMSCHVSGDPTMAPLCPCVPLDVFYGP